MAKPLTVPVPVKVKRSCALCRKTVHPRTRIVHVTCHEHAVQLLAAKIRELHGEVLTEMVGHAITSVFAEAGLGTT